MNAPVADTADLRTGVPIHDALLALLPLVGRWEGGGDGVVASTGAQFRYRQQLSFVHDGRPFLAYEARSWLVDEAGETIRLAWGAIRPGGAAVVVGLAPKGVDASVQAIEFQSDKALLGTYYGSGDAFADLPEYARLALAGDLDLARVVTHVDGLDGVEAALRRLRRGEGARTVLVVDPELAGRAPA